MPTYFRYRFFIICLITFFSISIFADANAQDLESIAEKTKSMEKIPGYFDVFWDAENGDAFVQVKNLDQDFLYLKSLRSGLGSNDVGLDRGLLGSEQVVRFERVGKRIFLVTPNLKYRGLSKDAAERQSIEEAFAEGVIFGFDIEAKTGNQYLIKVNSLLVRDHMAIARRMKRSDGGSYKFESSKSAVFPAELKSFPKNTEMEARITFSSEDPGRYVRSVAADPNNISLRVHHSFIELPDGNFELRPFHPGSGLYAHNFYNYSAPIDAPLAQKSLVRHRLLKKNPSAARSEAVEPIVYYLDPGTPEPVRTALLDGAKWWNDAFEEAGYINAFQVKMLPHGADPLDVRYNTIQWVHRSTRGWSYGASVTDPRTGEIIKGHVSLGSLRVRQDYLIALGLIGEFDSLDANGLDPMLELSLARLRQLSAHEIGHTIGMQHNFAASPSNRSSVMDYPAPLVLLNDEGQIDLSKAYASGIGDWDIVSVKYGYTDLRGVESAADSLASILETARSGQLQFITDTDARPLGGSHPGAHLWDNGSDALSAFESEMKVRKHALANLGPEVLRDGQPLAQLEEVLVPIYLRHRYQIEAVVKNIGGLNYSYSIKGESSDAPTTVDYRIQNKSLDALLSAVTPEALRIPDYISDMIPPRPTGYSNTREVFDSRAGLVFDPYVPAENIADLVFSAIANPQRASRLIYQHLADEQLPSLSTVLSNTSQQVFDTDTDESAIDGHLRNIVRRSWLYRLFELKESPNTSPEVQAIVLRELINIDDMLITQAGISPQLYFLRDQLNKFLEGNLDLETLPKRASTPPGSPIGCGGELY